MKEKAKLAVLEVRRKQKYHFDKIQFCREYNMVLQEQLHIEMEKEYSQLAMKLEDILGTGMIMMPS